MVTCGIAMKIPAAQFKAECLRLMDQVAKTRKPVVITKHGRPVAQLAPVAAAVDSCFGYMKDTLRITGDVLSPVDAEWSAISGDEDHLYERTPAKAARKK